MGPTQYCNHLTHSSLSSAHPRCPKQSAKSQRSFLFLFFFTVPHISIYFLLSVSILFPPRRYFTLCPSCCPLYLLNPSVPLFLSQALCLTTESMQINATPRKRRCFCHQRGRTGQPDVDISNSISNLCAIIGGRDNVQSKSSLKH